MTFVRAEHVIKHVIYPPQKILFKYKPRKGLAFPGSKLWPRSNFQWSLTQYWDSPLKALARRFSSYSRAPLTKCERAVISELSDKWHRKLNYAFCGLKHLENITGFSRRGIQYALQKLEVKGFLRIDRSQTKYRTSQYYLMFDAMENILEGKPLSGQKYLKKRLDIMRKSKKVHPNISKYINPPSILRSGVHLALEKAATTNFDTQKPDFNPSSTAIDRRYKHIVRIIQDKAVHLRSSYNQGNLCCFYYEVSANTVFDEELTKNLHHADQVIVDAVFWVLARLSSANTYVAGTLTDIINNYGKTNAIRT